MKTNSAETRVGQSGPIAGCHFLLDTATLNILSYYRGIPAVKRWNVVLT